MVSRFSVSLLMTAAIAWAAPLSAQEAGATRDLSSAIDSASDPLWPAPDPQFEVIEPPLLTNLSGNTAMADCCRPCWWGQAEYLLWWIPGTHVPALATTGSAADPLPAAIGQPGTRILFGNSVLNDGSRSGARLALGAWLDPHQCRGVEVTYLTLGSEDTRFRASEDDFPVLGRPFFNTVTNNQDARLIAHPGTVAGTLEIAAETDFDSWEVLYRRACSRSSGVTVDLLVGYRLLELDDRVRIGESTRSLSGPTAGTTFDLFDDFDIHNRFHGGEIGVLLQGRENPCWSWEALAKVALGGSNYRADVSGQTVTRDTVGNVSTVDAGLLTQGTNIGSFRWDEFATVTEIGITLRRDLRCGWTASFGYSVVYWSDVARAGDQIDTTVNPSQIPPGMLSGAARPAFPFRTTDFWAQGLRFGLERKF